MPADRLTAETAKVGMRVVCVDPSLSYPRLDRGEVYTISKTAELVPGGGGKQIELAEIDGARYLPSRFIPADPEPDAYDAAQKIHDEIGCTPALRAAYVEYNKHQKPALPAMTPELVAALRAHYEWAGPHEPGRKWPPNLKKLWAAIEACPGLLHPAPPATTQREATISGEWFACPPRERMARAIEEADKRPIRDGHATSLPNDVSDWGAALADAALSVAAAICLERCAEIRGRIDLMDDDATAARFEQRALVAWQLAQDFRGGSSDEG